MSNTSINKSCFFAAPRETVWAFLTEKDKLAQWFHPSTADLVEGEDYQLVKKGSDPVEPILWGTVLKMDKPLTLIYTFTFDAFNGATTTVTWTLEEISGGTRLTLKHEGISEAAGEASMGLLMALDKGWDEHFDTLRGSIPSATNRASD